MIEYKPLTAAELIVELGKIPADTLVKTSSHDSEWGYWYLNGVSGVSDNGVLGYAGILESGSDWDDYEEEVDDESPEA